MPSVEVGIFNSSTHVLVAAAVTDVGGRAAFLLPGSAGVGTSYEVRFYKSGVNFHGLRTIKVIEPALAGAPNKFDHTGADSNILGISSSPFLCRCTMVMVDFESQPLPDKTIRITAKVDSVSKTPKIINGMMVTPDEMEFRTDHNGRAWADLIRTGQYYVTWGGDDTNVYLITVPDQYAVNLVELVHPFPVLWDWDDTVAPGNSVSITVGSSVVIPLKVIFSDYHTAKIGLETYFTLVVTGAAASINHAWSDIGLTITGLAPGSVVITPTLRTDILPNRWPVPAIAAPGLAITVS